MIYEIVEKYKREFPDTLLKRGSLLAIFGMWRYEGQGRMLEYLQFLYDIGIITAHEMSRLFDLAEGEMTDDR